jgi:hypothetical protein
MRISPVNRIVAITGKPYMCKCGASFPVSCAREYRIHRATCSTKKQ